MKVFTVDDYMEASAERQKEVSAWLSRYDLADAGVCLITSRKSLTEDQSQGIVLEDDHLAVYADIAVKRYIDPENFIMISNSDISQNAYTKVAEFFFDDFPWEV